MLTRPVPIDVLGQLRWQTTEEIYINITARPGLGAVVCGDNEGTIWLYDLQTNIVAEADSENFKMKPVKVTCIMIFSIPMHFTSRQQKPLSGRIPRLRTVHAQDMV